MNDRLRNALSAVLGVVLIAPVALAQNAEPKRGQGTDSSTSKSAATVTATPAPGAEPPRPFSPFGDPKKFNKFGGWGGVGGAMGQWGFGQSMLIMNPVVQSELKLSEAQKEKLKLWADDMRERAQTMFRRPEANAGEDGGAPDGAGDGGAPGRPGQGGPGGMPNITQMFAMLNNFSAMLREQEQAFSEILSKSQRKRLAQIGLQMEGLSAVSRPEVASLLNLTESQIENIKEILVELQLQQMGFWMQQAVAMRSARGNRPGQDPQANGAGPTPAAKSNSPRRRSSTSKKEATTKDATEKEATTKDATPKPDDDVDPEVRRAERMKAFQTRFESMRQGADRLQEAAILKIYRQLTKRQRGIFENLLGDPFDVDKMVRDGGFGPPGSRPPNGATSSTTTTTTDVKNKPATATDAEPRKSTRLRDLRGVSKPDPER